MVYFSESFKAATQIFIPLQVMDLSLVVLQKHE